MLVKLKVGHTKKKLFFRCCCCCCWDFISYSTLRTKRIIRTEFVPIYGGMVKSRSSSRSDVFAVCDCAQHDHRFDVLFAFTIVCVWVGWLVRLAIIVWVYFIWKRLLSEQLICMLMRYVMRACVAYDDCDDNDNDDCFGINSKSITIYKDKQKIVAPICI